MAERSKEREGVENLSFGFDPTRVFGDVRKDARKSKRKKKRDDMEEMMEGAFDIGSGGLGIDTFSLATPEIDPLGLGEDFGERIGRPAGQANGKGSLLDEAGFLGVIGKQQLTVPSVSTGRAPRRPRARPSRARIPKSAKVKDDFEIFDDKGELLFTSTSLTKTRKKLASLRKKGQEVTFERTRRSPIQSRTGSRFGTVDEKFGEVLFSNIGGLRKRIKNFREGRRTPREDPPMLEFKERPTEARPPEREPPALPDFSSRRTAV